jgi:hypothetical protein
MPGTVGAAGRLCARNAGVIRRKRKAMVRLERVFKRNPLADECRPRDNGRKGLRR